MAVFNQKFLIEAGRPVQMSFLEELVKFCKKCGAEMQEEFGCTDVKCEEFGALQLGKAVSGSVRYTIIRLDPKTKTFLGFWDAYDSYETMDKAKLRLRRLREDYPISAGYLYEIAGVVPVPITDEELA